HLLPNRPVMRGDGAGRSAQRACERSSDWPRGARSAPPTRSREQTHTAQRSPDPKVCNSTSLVMRSSRQRQAVTAYCFIAPALVIFCVFTLLPIGIALYLSLTDYDVFTRLNWIGLQNYQDVFDDEYFWRALWNTVTYTVWSVPLSMAIGL